LKKIFIFIFIFMISSLFAETKIVIKDYSEMSNKEVSQKLSDIYFITNKQNEQRDFVLFEMLNKCMVLDHNLSKDVMVSRFNFYFREFNIFMKDVFINLYSNMSEKEKKLFQETNEQQKIKILQTQLYKLYKIKIYNKKITTSNEFFEEIIKYFFPSKIFLPLLDEYSPQLKDCSVKIFIIFDKKNYL